MAFLGCSHSSLNELERLESWSLLKEGMRVREVVELVGQPSDTTSFLQTHMSGAVTVRKTFLTFPDGGSAFFMDGELSSWDRPQKVIDTKGLFE